MYTDTAKHYDLLTDEGNDPVLDPPALKAYMEKWDGDSFIEMLAPKASMTVLEIGCGTGRLAVKIAPMVKNWTGIDISPKTAEKAKMHLTGENVRIICGDFVSREFNTVFDAVYSSLTFMHIEDKEEAVEKVHRVLSEKGVFVLSIDKNQSEILDFVTRKIKIYPDSPEETFRLLQNAGFKNIERTETEFAFIFRCEK